MRHRLRHAPELLDEETHDPVVLERSLAHVAQVNRYLGGTSAVLAAISDMLVRGAHIRILDIGTGSADIPRAIVDAARAAGAHVSITATDLHPQMRALATAHCTTYPEIVIDSADALALPYTDNSFDAVLLSLMIHHLEEDAPAVALREAGRVGRRVVVNELERGWANYFGALLLGHTWWRGNPLTRHDGPLSVLRSFTAAELGEIARAAGLRNVRIERRWFFRLVLTAEGAVA